MVNSNFLLHYRPVRAYIYWDFLSAYETMTICSTKLFNLPFINADVLLLPCYHLIMILIRQSFSRIIYYNQMIF